MAWVGTVFFVFFPAAGRAVAQDDPTLSVEPNRILWTQAPGATGYDVLRGDVNLVRQSGDGFTAAVQVCLADDFTDTQLGYLGVPKVGEAFFFLVRAGTGDVAGTYDDGGAGQVAPRDAAIDAAAPACFSTVTSRAPIAIGGDNQFDAGHGVVAGSGTFADPYVISGWDIQCSQPTGTTGIAIRHTTAAYLIRNVRVRLCGTGIQLDRSGDGTVERCRLSGGGQGIQVSDSTQVLVERNAIDGVSGAGILVDSGGTAVVRRNTITGSGLGIDLDGALSCDVYDNNLVGNTLQARDLNGSPSRWNRPYPQVWTDPEGGNYWSGHAGQDACSGSDQGFCPGGGGPDGFSDQPVTFDASIDQYPLMAPASDEGDTLPPTVAIAPHAPSPSSTVTITGQAQDLGTGVQTLRARVNGGAWTSVPCCNPWSLSATLVPGDNVIEAQAIDRAQNVSSLARSTVTYSPPPPTTWQAVLQTTRISYWPGAPVSFIVRVTNTSSQTASLNFPSSCEAHFQVLDAGAHVLYDSRNHVGCLPVFTQESVPAGGSITWSFAWLQKDDGGTQVSWPASYTMRGLVDSMETVPQPTAMITIEQGEPYPQVGAGEGDVTMP
ncbi:MAG TPA: NosD domain-containing protein [Candidatus Polarisedimenticolia bacterium]|nr:NosD domain-containing protein [Candidatus Polarisedimenticolia bacterium]